MHFYPFTHCSDHSAVCDKNQTQMDRTRLLDTPYTGFDELNQIAQQNHRRPTVFRSRNKQSSLNHENDNTFTLSGTSTQSYNNTARKTTKCSKCCSCCHYFGCDPLVVRHKGTRQIINYSADALTTFGFFKTDGTVCRTKFLWIQTIILLSITAGVGIVGYQTDFVMKNDLTSLYHLVTFLNGLSTFLLSLFISLSLSRWWSVRLLLTELWTVIGEISMLSATYLNKNQPKQLQIRKKIIRYGLLSFALLFKDARGESIDEYLENYIKNGLCTSRESNVLKKVAIKSETPWIWNCALIARSIENDDLPSGLRYDFHSRCLRGRTAVNNVLTYIQTPLPLIYVHLIVTLVKMTSIIWCLYVGCVVAQAFDETNNKTDSHDVWPLMLAVLIVPTVYQSALELHRKLSNPFLNTSSGFPEATYYSALRKECYDICSVVDGCEYLVEENNDVENGNGGNDGLGEKKNTEDDDEKVVLKVSSPGVMNISTTTRTKGVLEV